MAFTFDVNETPATGAGAMFLFKQNMKTAGWTVMSSSDGTTYLAGGDQISVSGSGAGGMANSGSWFVLQGPNPSYKRQLAIQRGNDNQHWKIKYSGAAGFVGGTANSASMPSATDQGILAGLGGSDALPNYAQIFDADGTYRFHTGAGGIQDNYTFFMFATVAGTTVVHTAFAMDVMISGSYASIDPDPAVLYIDYNTTTPANIFNSGITGASSGLTGITTPAGLFLNQYVNIKGHTIGNSFPKGLGTNPYSRQDDYLPVVWGRPVSLGLPFGLKGVSTMMLWAGFGRQNLDTLTINALKDHIFINALALPWTGQDPII